MSRPRKSLTVATAALATVLAAGMLATDVGTTTALWSRQLVFDGITVIAGDVQPPDPGPIDVERVDDLGDTIRLYDQNVLKRRIAFDLTLSLEGLDLPVIFQMQRVWNNGAPVSNDFMENQRYFQFVSPVVGANHYMQDNWLDKVAISDQDAWPPGNPAEVIRVAPGTTSVKVHAWIDVSMSWANPTPFFVDGGTLTARLTDVHGVVLETLTAQLPRLWGVTLPPGWVSSTSAAVSPARIALPQEPVLSGQEAGAGPDPEADQEPDHGRPPVALDPEPTPDDESWPGTDPAPETDEEHATEPDDEADEADGPGLELPDDTTDDAHDEKTEAT